MTNSEGVTTYTYDKNNRLTNSAGTTYTYDNNGNLLSKTGTVSGTYTFDLFGRMTGSDVNNVVSTYTYDSNGIRTSKTVNGVMTNFINDGAYVVGEVSGDSIVKYTYGSGLVNINNNGTVGCYHTDEHGNISTIINFDREIVANYDFDAFGNEIVTTADYYNPMRYCGEYCDAETGLIYLRARYYDPAIGRFISEDPIKDGTNWYVYCSNNPIAFVDPSGLKEGDWFDSEEDAARDFAENYNPISIQEDVEYGAYIYTFTGARKEGDDVVVKRFYTYSQPVKGESHSIDTTEFKELNPDYYNKTAIVHTHSAYNESYDNESFSGEDASVTKNMGLNRIYVATPGGYLKMLDLKEVKVKKIAEVPFDVNSPDKPWYRFWGGVTREE